EKLPYLGPEKTRSHLVKSVKPLADAFDVDLHLAIPEGRALSSDPAYWAKRDQVAKKLGRPKVEAFRRYDHFSGGFVNPLKWFQDQKIFGGFSEGMSNTSLREVFDPQKLYSVRRTWSGALQPTPGYFSLAQT